MADITTAFVKQFHDTIEHLVQQEGSLLRMAVRQESNITGEEGFFDQLGATTAVKRTTRNSDTNIIKSDHQRRRVSFEDYEWADLIDRQDRLRLLLSLNSDYMQSAAWSIGRAMDTEIIAKFNGTAFTGKTGTTATAFPGGNLIGDGGVGLTLDKLRDAKAQLDSSAVNIRIPRWIAVSPEGIRDLLEDSTVTSSDFNTVRALVNGDINQYMGFNFITIPSLLPIAATIRSCFAWAQDGMLLAVQDDVTTSIDRRPDKSNATQVLVQSTFGATRMQEEKVLQIDIVE